MSRSETVRWLFTDTVFIVDYLLTDFSTNQNSRTRDSVTKSGTRREPSEVDG